MTTTELQAKLDKAAKFIAEHNNMLAKLGLPEFDTEDIIKRIKLQGGTSSERLKKFSYEDLVACFVLKDTGQTVPIVLAKEIAALFRDEPNGRKARYRDRHAGRRR